MSTTRVKRAPSHRAAPVPRLYPLDVAAASLGIGSTKIGELVASGELPSVKIGRRRLVAADDLDAYVAKLRAQQRNRIGRIPTTAAPSSEPSNVSGRALGRVAS